MNYIKEIFQKLTKGQFLSHNSNNSEDRRMYSDLDENFQEYYDYYKQIGLILVRADNYFHFTREVDEVKTEDKLRGMYCYIDYLHVLEESTRHKVDVGETITISMVEKTVTETQTLQDYIYKHMVNKDKPETTCRGVIIDMFRELTNKGFFELIDKNTDKYLVTDAFAYLQDIVELIKPKSDTYNETI